MILDELSNIAAQCGNCRLVISYGGDEQFTAGISDGITTPLVVKGTLPELSAELTEKLPTYLELVLKEANDRKAKEEAEKQEAARKAAEARLKKEEADRKATQKKAAEEAKSAQAELSLF